MFGSHLFLMVPYEAASEVSSILESRIAGTAISGNVEETGRVLSALPCWSFSSLVSWCIQASVTVLDVFGVSEMYKVRSKTRSFIPSGCVIDWSCSRGDGGVLVRCPWHVS